ncbi:MAG TPA: ectoine hydroxylase [Porticoccaceae bacterium]|nr:ectoine hydroxylase [Porticoccaceae bacterium]
MSVSNANRTSLQEDRYPSRGLLKAQLVERQDPVVYGQSDATSPLPRDQVEAYRRDGFLVLEGVFSDVEIDHLQREMARLLGDREIHAAGETITERSTDEIRSIFRVHQSSPVFEALSRDPRLVELARYLLGDAIYVHQSRLNFKPGFRGKEFYWHSDFETWHVEDGMPAMRALSMSITLTDNDCNNGPLMLIPGSHRYYAVCEGETPENHFESSLKKQQYGVPSDACLSQLVERGGIYTATSSPGSVIIFDCNTMHGSSSNITPYPRSNAFFVYNAISNRLQSPFCDRPPRPEYISARENITPLIVAAPHDVTAT